MPLPGDDVVIYYNGFELGVPSGDPEARVGRFDAGAFVEELGVVTMDELSVDELPGPVATPTQIWAAKFTLPATVTDFSDWTAVIKANISLVDRYFSSPIELVQNVGQRPLSEFGGADLSLAGPWAVQQLKEIRRKVDRLVLPQQLVDTFVRDRITVQASPRLVQAGEDATFEFTLIDEENKGLLNIEGATIRFKAEDEETMLAAWDVACNITDNEGRCEAIVDSSLTIAGSYRCQVEVTQPSSLVVKSQVFTVVIGVSV